MLRSWTTGPLLGVGLAVWAILAACSPQGSREGRLGVVVSISPLAEFVEAIGGDRVRVSVMVPPGANYHTYEPTPSQLVKVGEAEIFAKVGSGIEFELVWMDRIRQTNDRMLVVDASQGIQLIGFAGGQEEGEGEHGGVDPHVWLSPRNAGKMVQNIYEGLVQVDPYHADFYRANRDAYLRELEALDKEIRATLEGAAGRKFIVFHPGWGYFARDYGLEQVPVEVGGKEPSARDIARLIEVAQREGSRVVFASPQFNPRSAEVIAGAIGGLVVLIDPLAKDYVVNLRQVARELAEAMK